MAQKRRPWSREELMAAMHLYCRTPFGRMHSRNPEIIHLASVIHRTPSSVAMKLVNLASLDPAERERGVKGLSKASAGDRQIWSDFHADWQGMVEASAAILDNFETDAAQRDPSPLALEKQTESTREVTVRRGQGYFRAMILASYGSRCALTGCSEPGFLIASHIVPWSADAALRLDPRNGICLAPVKDKAFDAGLISLDDDFRVIVSRRLERMPRDESVLAPLVALAGHQVSLPERFQPERSYLAIHRESLFAQNN